MDFEVQNSIVPTAYNLARFKVSGNLPTLQLNMSDIKYRSLMRLIDVCIPHFDDDTPKKPRVPQAPKSEFPLSPLPPTFALPGVFRAKEIAYMVEDQHSIAEQRGEGEEGAGEESFEAPSGDTDVSFPSRALFCGLTDEKIQEPQNPSAHLRIGFSSAKT
jgi:vacuolar protein sorting-associated protein 13A/C